MKRDEYLSVDLDLINNDELSDKELVDLLLNRFKLNEKEIAVRVKKSPKIKFAYATKSVRLYRQAVELFQLGYFESTIMVCRATAEQLASELFYEQINIEGDEETITKLAETLDFRKLVDEILFDKIPEKSIITKTQKELFHKVYDLGNLYIHPNKRKLTIQPEENAEDTLDNVAKLIDELRDILKDYDIKQGKLTKKLNSKNYKRGIKLG